jgi:hypothetical protein
MRVIRVLPETGWTGVDNTVARSRRISWRAKGLLLELLSYPETNDITIAKLASWGAKSRTEGHVAEGREALQAAMRELEREGYVVHDRTRDKATGHWSTTTYVSTDPAAVARLAPSTALPRPVNPRSVDPYSADPYSVDQSLSTSKTDEKTVNKTEEEEAGLQYTSSLASAREGAAGKQDRGAAIEADLRVRYETIQQADETYLRDRLLKFERKRPAIFRKYRNAAISQIENGEWPKRLQEVGSSRLIDELSMMYAVRHYAYSDSGIIPEWLFRFPLRSVS